MANEFNVLAKIKLKVEDRMYTCMTLLLSLLVPLMAVRPAILRSTHFDWLRIYRFCIRENNRYEVIEEEEEKWRTSNCTCLWNDYSGTRVTSKRYIHILSMHFISALFRLFIRSPHAYFTFTLFFSFSFFRTVSCSCSSGGRRYSPYCIQFSSSCSFSLLLFFYVPCHRQLCWYSGLFDIALRMRRLKAKGWWWERESKCIQYLSCTSNCTSLAMVLIGFALLSLMRSWIGEFSKCKAFNWPWNEEKIERISG